MSADVQLFDATGRRRSPATLPEFHVGRAPANKGQRSLLTRRRSMRSSRSCVWRERRPVRQSPERVDRGALAGGASDRRGAVADRDRSRATARLDFVRYGKGDRRRLVGMDAWGWTALESWVAEREMLPVGPLFCVVAGPTRGHAWSASAARLELHRTAVAAGVRRRVAPHQLRHAHAVELLREGIALPLIQRQLGHSHLSTTGTYLQGISSEEIISTVHARRAPMMHASAGLELESATRERTTRSRDPAGRPPRGSDDRSPRKQQSAATAPGVAKRKPASTISGEQSDRQLSAGASRQTGPQLASSTDSDCAHWGLSPVRATCLWPTRSRTAASPPIPRSTAMIAFEGLLPYA